MTCAACEEAAQRMKAAGHRNWRTGFACYDCAAVDLDAWAAANGVDLSEETASDARTGADDTTQGGGAMTRGNAPQMLPGSQRALPERRPSNARAVMNSRETAEGDDVDFFPTRPWGSRAGGEIIRQIDPRARSAWECAVGVGMMAHGLDDYFPVVHGSDICIYDPALYAARGWVQHDFTAGDPDPFASSGGADWIITNPPFDDVEAFIQQAWARSRRGVAMLLRLVCLSGQARHRLLHGTGPDGMQLTVFAPFSERLPMHRGFWDPTRTTATDYAWFIWCKPGVGPRLPVVLGRRRPVIFDIPPGTEHRLTRPDDAALFSAALPPSDPKGTRS